MPRPPHGKRPRSPLARDLRDKSRRPATKRESEAGWDHVAAWYDRLVGDEGSDYHRNVILPATMRLLDPQRGEKIIDLCCGQGVLTRLLLEHPVGQVIAVDASAKLIAAARSRGQAREGIPAPAGGSTHAPAARGGIPAPAAGGYAAASAGGHADARVRYVVRDVTHLGDLADGTFDAAACVMAVQDVEDVAAFFDGLGKALRPGGRAVIVMMHPCFRVPRQSDWGWDEAKKTQYRRVDRYLSPMQVPIATHPGSDPGQQTFFHHRALNTYISALGHAGLAVIAAEEPTSHREPPPGPRHRGQKRSFEEIPVFLALKAIRVR